jgi:hypothetical protein
MAAPAVEKEPAEEAGAECNEAARPASLDSTFVLSHTFSICGG